MSRFFEFLETEIKGLRVARLKKITDERGFFERLYCIYEFTPVLFDRKIVQINHTFTHKLGTIRGLHFQNPPYSETKIVTCIQGSVFDVAVDIRRNSPTFLSWYGRVLSEQNGESLVIPEGFAHGFQSLEENSEMLYLHTAAYEPEAEGGLNALDLSLGIDWPLPVTMRSDRDISLPAASGFKGILL